MIKNTEAKTWHGVWYLPSAEEKHHGVLTYNPQEGFSLKILSEGFESPYVEVDLPTKIFQPASKGGVYGPRDISEPYDAIYGEVEGRLVTLFDVFSGGGTQKYGSQASYTHANYYPQAMAIGAHIPSKSTKIVASLDVSIDFLHIWLNDTGWLQVGMTIHNDATPHDREHFTRVRLPQSYGPRRGVKLEDGTALTISFEGVLPGLTWSAYEYESRSSIAASVRFNGEEGARSLESFQSRVLALETLISICLDRPCTSNSFSCEIQCGDELRRLELLMPRKGPVPNPEATGKYLDGLAFCDDARKFTDFFERWFQLYDQNPSVAFLNGFLNGDSPTVLEPSLMMAQALLESFHKTMYGKNFKDLLPSTIDACEEFKPSKTPEEIKRVTAFKRALDLYLRMPEKIRSTLISNECNWASTLIQARNDITHDASLQKHEPLEAIAAAKVTVAVITIHVLLHLGIDEEELLQSLYGHNSLSKARKLAADYLQ